MSENLPDLRPEVGDSLAAFGREVLKWNRSTNLITRKDPERTLIRLLVDSLFLLNVIEGEEAFLDIGAGAGFPSVPVLLCSRAWGILAEARKRRAVFLNHILHTLRIDRASVVEQAVSPESELMSRKFDCLWSKAGIPLDELVACGERCLRRGGKIIIFHSMEGKKTRENLKRLLERHGFSLPLFQLFSWPELYLTRTVVICRKL